MRGVPDRTVRPWQRHFGHAGALVVAMEAGAIQEGEPMGLFGNPKSSVEKKAAEFDFGERKELAGPLPVVENLVETVQWLENARQKVSSGNASCCLVVCAPNSIDGVAMELTVGEIANRFAHSLRSYRHSAGFPRRR